MKKVIFTQRIDFIKNYNEIRDSIDQNLSKLLIQAKYLPIPVPNQLGLSKNNEQKIAKSIINDWLLAINPDAVVLSGGNDIGQYTNRDETEKFLIEWAQIKKIPVLGICRGMQIMNIWAGGTLERVDNHVGVRHKLNIKGSLDKWPSEVNSFHTWGIHYCSSDFEIKAKSNDGVIMAIKHISLPWEGWMWHPERETPFIDKDVNRLRELFNHG